MMIEQRTTPLCEEPQAANKKGKETREQVKNQGPGADKHIIFKAQQQQAKKSNERAKNTDKEQRRSGQARLHKEQ